MTSTRLVPILNTCKQKKKVFLAQTIEICGETPRKRLLRRLVKSLGTESPVNLRGENDLASLPLSISMSLQGDNILTR